MIGQLRGTLERLGTDQVLLDVGGVGYQVRIPLSTYYELEQVGLGETARLLIHTHVRAEALELFGFRTENELVLFERLITISGIGPRLAQVVLSGMAPEEVLQALANGEVARLVRIPGIGKKTAERMVLELRDSAQELVRAAGAEVAVEIDDVAGDTVAALVNLGYRAKEAQKTVDDVRQDHADAPFQELLRLALKKLARV